MRNVNKYNISSATDTIATIMLLVSTNYEVIAPKSTITHDLPHCRQ